MTAKFGCQLPPSDNVEQLISIANHCEDSGYDSVWAHDHLSPYWIESGSSLECWTVLSAIAEKTSKIGVGSLVTNVALRNPALLAKMSSTVDTVSKGRLTLGLGTGDKLSRTELLSHGFRFPDFEERVTRLKETILTLKAMWSEDKATFHGVYYNVSGATNWPKLHQKPHPPIWIGGKHHRILDLVAELADGWNYWGLGKGELRERIQYLAARCKEQKRPSQSIVKSWSGVIPPLTNKANSRQEMSKLIQGVKDESGSEITCFIGSFSSQASYDNYEAFADAVRSLN